jgi:hypothetical protein
MGFGPGLMNHILQPKFKRAMATSAGYNQQARDQIGTSYGEAKDYQRPWYDYGQKALTDFQAWGADPNAITSDPSYKWRLGQGTEALENSAAARGGLLSGNTGKALQDYGQGAASQEYQNEFGRWMQKLGIGERASSNMSNLATGEGNALATLLSHQGDNTFNQFLKSAQEVRAAENDFNNVLQSWMPSSMGGGSPTGGASNTGGGGGGSNDWQNTSSNFGSNYTSGGYGGGYF